MNYNKAVLYQRYEFGAYAATSALQTRGAGAFGGAPDYQAFNSDTDASLQVTNLPAGVGETPQSTEAKIGPYALQDFTLFYILRYGFPPSKIAFMAR